MSDEMEFYKKLPKVELHAHINGSVSRETLSQLIESKQEVMDANLHLAYSKGEEGTSDRTFQMFKLIHSLVDSEEATYKITKDVIHEFAADNVKYIELRTTPRDEPKTGMTRESYVQTVLRAIEDCEREPQLDIVVRLLLAIDRRQTVQLADKTVDLAIKYRELSGGIVVGIDLSGDPAVGDATDFIPVLQRAQKYNLQLALHIAEVPAPEETMTLLQVIPGRIGHGTCLEPETGGTKEIVDHVLKHHIPIELCLTSNIINKTVTAFDNHHFKFWYQQGHLCVICTDDKGVFSTSLSEEYAIAADTFNVSREQMWELSRRSIDCIFEGEDIKQKLREKWDSLKKEVFEVRQK